jgi:TusA-related sulfurtransferase
VFGIAVDAARGLVEVTLAGLLEPSEAADYIARVRKAFVVHGLRSPYAMVIDVSACPIQAQVTIAALREHMAEMPKAHALAIVAGDSLARMQIRRLFTQPYARVVATQAEAHAWVLSGIEPANPLVMPMAS